MNAYQTAALKIGISLLASPLAKPAMEKALGLVELDLEATTEALAWHTKHDHQRHVPGLEADLLILTEAQSLLQRLLERMAEA